MSKIIVIDHLDKSTCEELINIYHKNELGAHSWVTDNPNQKMFPLDFRSIFVGKQTLLGVIDEIMDLVKKYFWEVELEWGEIVYRLKDCSSAFHFDTQSSKTALTSLTYLNDNFENGETCFRDGTKIKPVTGRTVIFDGNYYEHAVAPSTDTRYAMPIWYKEIS